MCTDRQCLRSQPFLVTSELKYAVSVSLICACLGLTPFPLSQSIIKLTEFGTRLQELGALDDFAAFWITVSNGDKMDL